MDKHLHYSIEESSNLLNAIAERFPAFYQKKTGQILNDYLKTKNLETYEELKKKGKEPLWHHLIGDFLAGKSTADSGNNKSFWDDSCLKGKEAIIGDARVLYREINLFSSKPKSQVGSISLSKIINILDKYFDYKGSGLELDEYISKNKFGKIKDINSIDEQKLDFLTQNEWVALCYEEFEIGNPYGWAVKALEVSFSKEKKIVMSALEDGSKFYEGSFEIIHKGNLYLEMGPLNVSGDRYLRCFFDFGNEWHLDNPEISIGVYYNLRKQNIILGTTLLVKKELVGISEDFMIFNRGEGLNETFRKFFSDKGKNFIKPPREIYKLDTLTAKIDQLNNQYYNILHGAEYDLFLSIPLTVGEKNNIYEKNSQIAASVVNIFKEDYRFLKITCACLDEKGMTLNIDRFKESYVTPIMLHNKEKLEMSKYFVLIYPNTGDHSRISYAISEVGMAIAYKKPILILFNVAIEKTLPRAFTKSQLPNIHVIPYICNEGEEDLIAISRVLKNEVNKRAFFKF